jgi:hypothetical protein
MPRLKNIGKVVLGVGPFRGKGYLWRIKNEVGGRQLEGKSTHARKTCKEHMQGNLTTLGLGFL